MQLCIYRRLNTFTRNGRLQEERNYNKSRVLERTCHYHSIRSSHLSNCFTTLDGGREIRAEILIAEAIYKPNLGGK